MQFTELTPDEFRAYAASSPYKSFYQTPEIANLRESAGWVPYYFGVTVQGELRAATLLVAKPAFLGKSVFYAPGGPLIDFEDAELLTFFVKNLRKYLKSHNGYVLHIEPYYQYLERDRDGLPVVGGFDHQAAARNLQTLGFTKLPTSDEPQYQFVLDLTTPSLDHPLLSSPAKSDSKSDSKSGSQPTPKSGSKSTPKSASAPVTKSTSKPTVKPTPESATNSTSVSAHKSNPDSTPRPLTEAELLASFKRNTRNHIRKAEKMGVTVRQLDRSELSRFKAITESTSTRRDFADKSLAYYQQMYDLFSPRGEVQFLLAEADGHDLSAAMFMLYGDEVIYLFSGSAQEYMREYNAQYAIQWHMIKYAAAHGFQKYNFYGIHGLPDPSDPDYGIYDFKKGFGGHVVELIGAHELPISQPFYSLHRLLSHLRSK